MKKLLSVLSVFALAAIAAGTASAGSIKTPASLNSGDQFRIVFVTSTTTTAISSNFSTYDNIVSSDASGTTYYGKPVQWKAIVSTPSVSAKDHIYQPSTDFQGYFKVDGTRVSFGGDLWSGNLSSAIDIDILGRPNRATVWTGTNRNGTTFYPMGSPTGSSIMGLAWHTFYWVGWASDSSALKYKLYGVSEVLTVPSAVPEPSTAVLAGLGGLAALVYSFKRKRNS